MLAHLRANFWLWFFTVVLCCILYPAAIWAIGQGLFHDKAQGSLILDAKGKPIGSRLIGQPFTSDEWFQPRPSATTPGYNAAASGGSNYAANNILLRDRVARQLGPIVKYAGGREEGTTRRRGHRKLVPEGQIRREAGTGRPMGGEVSHDRAELGEKRHDRRQVRPERPVHCGRGRRPTPRRSSSGRRTTPTRPIQSLRTWPWPSSPASRRTIRGCSPARWSEGDEKSPAGQGRVGHPKRLLRHVAARESGRRPGERFPATR